jgi:hypothetical protein
MESIKMEKSFYFTCAEVMQEAEMYYKAKNVNDKYYVPTYKEIKTMFEQIWTKKGYVWKNGEFTIGQKSGFDAIFNKVMSVLCGLNYQFWVYEMRQDFLAQSARYYEENVRLDIDTTVKNRLNMDMEHLDKSFIITSEMQAGVEKFKKYLDNLELADQIDVDVYTKFVSRKRALYIVEGGIDHSKHINTSDFVQVRNYIYDQAYNLVKDQLLGTQSGE